MRNRRQGGFWDWQMVGIARLKKAVCTQPSNRSGSLRPCNAKPTERFSHHLPQHTASTQPDLMTTSGGPADPPWVLLLLEKREQAAQRADTQPQRLCLAQHLTAPGARPCARTDAGRPVRHHLVHHHRRPCARARHSRGVPAVPTHVFPSCEGGRAGTTPVEPRLLAQCGRRRGAAVHGGAEAGTGMGMGGRGAG